MRYIVLTTTTQYISLFFAVLTGATVDKTDLSASDGFSTIASLLHFGAQLAVASPTHVILILTIFQFFFWAAFFGTFLFMSSKNRAKRKELLTAEKDEVEIDKLLKRTGLYTNLQNLY